MCFVREIVLHNGSIYPIIGRKSTNHIPPPCAGVFSSSDHCRLVEESQIMAKFDHPNVMKLLGVSISKSKTFIIMPFMAQGSLLSYLRKHRAELTIHNADMTDMV